MRLRTWIGLSVLICLILYFYHGVASFDQSKSNSSYHIVPEYDRLMKRVLISLAVGDTSLESQHNILINLPEYTQILLLLPQNRIPIIENELKKQPYGQRTQLIGYETQNVNGHRVYLLFSEKNKLIYGDMSKDRIVPTGSKWVQDLFEVATKSNGDLILLVSDIHKWFDSYGKKESMKVISDNIYLNSLSSAGLEIKRLPITFEGGNIMVDAYKGKRILFYGGDIIRNTQTVWKSTQESIPSGDEINDMMRNLMGADHAVAVGKAKIQPPSLMFHLDQAMVFLANGIIGVTKIVGKPEKEASVPDEIKAVEEFLSELRLVLLRIGYQLVDIDTSVNNILNHQYYVNAIPYVDSITGRRTILVPIFSSHQTKLEEQLEMKNTAVFESLGYKVIHVRTNADAINGGIHCLINVLE